MAKEVIQKEDNDCCKGGCCNSVMDGFKYGFGFFLAFLTGTVLVCLSSMLLYYLFKALGLGF